MTHESPLGKTATYDGQYDPGLLFAIPRAESRSALGLGNELPFNGCDIWNAWELTWLGPSGVPQIVSAMIRIPAYSPNLIESKSLKLWLVTFRERRIFAENLAVEIGCTVDEIEGLTLSQVTLEQNTRGGLIETVRYCSGDARQS